MSAVEIPECAVVAAISYAVLGRFPDGTPCIEAGLIAAVPIVVSQLIGDLISAFQIHTEVPRAMGREEFVWGIEHCIQHLEAYQGLVDADVPK